jgi:hypothetical protein
MATATTVSLAKFTASVQAAVKNAVAKHPKFQMEAPNSISVSYLIRGIPPLESALANATVAEVQAFADAVASNLAQAHPDLLTSAGATVRGAVISVGGHLIIGIPPVTEVFNLEH